MLYDEIIDELVYDRFRYEAYTCGTCKGLSLLGCFEYEALDIPEGLPLPRLYPIGPDIDPPRHTVLEGNAIPPAVRNAFRDAWPLRHTAPSAFANQIRRTLEFICEDQKADGKTLSAQLQDLVNKGVFPQGVVDVADLVRELGNVGSHASEKQISIWDAELLDGLFRTILEYVYIGPARVKRLKERISLK
jgi:hypothetical protein